MDIIDNKIKKKLNLFNLEEERQKTIKNAFDKVVQTNIDTFFCDITNSTKIKSTFQNNFNKDLNRNNNKQVKQVFSENLINKNLTFTEKLWQDVYQKILKPSDNFSLHKFLYNEIYNLNLKNNLSKLQITKKISKSLDNVSDTQMDNNKLNSKASSQINDCKSNNTNSTDQKIFNPAWFPTEEFIKKTNIYKFMQKHNFNSYKELYNFSIDNYEKYWEKIINSLNINLKQKYDYVCNTKDIKKPNWLVAAKLNIIDSCFNAKSNKTAIIYSNEQNEIRKITYAELKSFVNKIAESLNKLNLTKGDAIAINMPMSYKAIAIYLAIIKAGFKVVSIAESFATKEIATRLKISNAKAIFTQDFIKRDKKTIPLYYKVIKANAPLAIVLLYDENLKNITLRKNDVRFDTFIKINQNKQANQTNQINQPDKSNFNSDYNCNDYNNNENNLKNASFLRQNKITPSTNKHENTICYPNNYINENNNSKHAHLSLKNKTTISKNQLENTTCNHNDHTNENAGSNTYYHEYESITCNPHDHINVLFSSGTTSSPKAILWDHTSAIKAAADGHMHQDITEHDIVCWPSSLGWMMGPWLIFATLINKATISLYHDAPTTKEFTKFIENSKTTILGVVPSLVKAWKKNNALENTDWSNIKLFSSTGETSNADDMLWLMSKANYKPVIEYCGGTEISGAYITSTVLQPNIPSTFSTPALGTNLTLLDEDFKESNKGEVFIMPPSMGLSRELLNKNHTDIYYKNLPKINNKILRRHGDQIEKLENGYYRALGRADDTMNLGGIKISSIEIEKSIANLNYINEVAAIAINDENDLGPSKLILYIVLNEKNEESINEKFKYNETFLKNLKKEIFPENFKKKSISENFNKKNISYKLKKNADKTDKTVSKSFNLIECDKNFTEKLKKELQLTINQNLNPLFRIHDVVIINALPRTNSNKIMRRLLRNDYNKL